MTIATTSSVSDAWIQNGRSVQWPRWTSHSPQTRTTTLPAAASTAPIRARPRIAAMTTGSSRRRATSNVTPASTIPPTKASTPTMCRNSAMV